MAAIWSYSPATRCIDVKLLVTGAAGQVGWELARSLQPLGEVIAVDRRQVDLTDADRLRAFVEGVGPDVVVNAAAYTAVDQAEREVDLARAINARAPAILAQACTAGGALLVHYSTDYVFDGASARPWLESDPTGPVNAYGRTKLEGEQAIAAQQGDWLVLRTAWVYSSRGRNFLKTMLRLAAERPELKVVDDQHGSPTFAADIAVATATIAARCARAKAGAPEFGIFHLVSSGEVTWCGFARAIMDGSKARGGPAVPVLAITTADYPTKARRPAYSKLDTGKLTRVFGVRMPDWCDALGRCLDDMLGARRAQLGSTEP